MPLAGRKRFSSVRSWSDSVRFRFCAVWHGFNSRSVRFRFGPAPVWSDSVLCSLVPMPVRFPCRLITFRLGLQSGSMRFRFDSPGSVRLDSGPFQNLREVTHRAALNGKKAFSGLYRAVWIQLSSPIRV